ncbi:MAG: DUF3426 domain-containing protein [Thermodesulfobacteriota bacterium]|nr:DUF3426 domain-containing protein [Thermodesulfobacteriota bacterium]
MIVECPKCKSTYNLPDDKVESGDMKVRCTECKEVFTAQAAKVSEPGEAEPEAPEAGEAESEGLEDIEGLDEALGEEAAEPEEAPEAAGDEPVAEAEDEGSVEEAVDDDAPDEGASDENAVEPEGDAEAVEDEAPADAEGDVEDTKDKDFAEDEDEDKEEDDDEASSEGESLSFDVEGGAKKKKKLKIKISKKLAIILAAAVLVLVLGGGAAWYFLSSDDTSATGLEARTEEDEEVLEDVRNISLKDIRQYYVDNDKAGRIFVVEGLAVNDFETPKGFIKIQADLFDEEGKVLGTREFLCGNSLSLYQLQVLGEEEIQSALADKDGIASSNVDLEPGMEVPFMAVFFNPPESVREFMVKVIQAKDPDQADEE